MDLHYKATGVMNVMTQLAQKRTPLNMKASYRRRVLSEFLFTGQLRICRNLESHSG